VASSSFTLIDGETLRPVAATLVGDRVAIEAGALRKGIGWELTPLGLCRGERCLPVREPARLERAGGVDVAELGRLLDRPLAVDAEERVAVLGAGAEDRRTRLASLEAPDFTLPDLDGRPHTLSGYRGKKILLIAWASW